MFYDEYSVNIRFKEDHFANIDHIHSLNGRILMMHSVADEIIPIEQARLLYKKYLANQGDKMIEFIEIEKLKHNQLHMYIRSDRYNDLQHEVLSFLSKITRDINIRE